jgi:DNA-binding Lrp family transcriptional regulator
MDSYILVHTELGRAAAVAAAIAGLDGVSFAEAVTGPYDVVARATTATEEELLHGLERRIREIPGVIRALACPMAEHERIWEMGTEPAALAAV